jgi:hypothetical protein
MLLRHFQRILADLEIQRMPRAHSFCYLEEYEIYRQSGAKRVRTSAFCIYLDVQRSRADESCSDMTQVRSTYLEPLQSIEPDRVDLASASSLPSALKGAAT